MPNLVAGIDGIVPVYEPNGRWCWWNLNEIYVGAQGANRYVPKVGDYVQDTALDIQYIVVSVSQTSLLSVLREVQTMNSTTNMTTEDILFGVGPGTQADTYRVYLDTSVIPYVLAVDVRLKVGGSMAAYARIFQGADVGASGLIVSRLYDQAGNFLTQNVPLELAAIDSHTNHSIKVVGVCYTNVALNDGELVTVVFYTPEGHVVSKRQLLVENTSFIRSVSAGQRYISHIALDSPFMSQTTDGLIEFPLNVPMQALKLFGTVYYSDGTRIRMPVDGTKFRLYGIEQYISTIVGQRMDLVLTYALEPNEAVYGAVTSDGKYITVPYSLVTTPSNGSYTVKLFGYPVWIDAVNGYRLEWYLYNLDRNVTFNVTGLVKFSQQSPSFNPILYGTKQNLVATINLGDVSGIFKDYIHIQSFSITLKQHGGDAATNWIVSEDAGLNKISFGENLHARATLTSNSTWTLDITSGYDNYLAWLGAVYYPTYPLVDRSVEILPPTPNYFTIVTNNSRHDFPIDQWDNVLNVGSGLAPKTTIFIEFFIRTPLSDIDLSIAGMPLLG